MPPDPLSRVNQVELRDAGKTVKINLQVYGFKVGAPVQISGYATQENGAVAAFHDIQEVTDITSDELAELQVSATSIEKPEFVKGVPVTVIANATASWITTLQPDDSDPSSEVIAKWAAPHATYAIRPPHQPSKGTSQPPETSEQTTEERPLRHGKWWDRIKADRLDVVMGGRFTRLFPYLPAARFDQKDLEALAGAMVAPPEGPEPEGQEDPEENKGIPAAYTYLGQFTDHDLTFDPISHLRETLTRARLRALVDFRTPRFDLDNLYGRGPDDQPYMYEDDGICMLPGELMPGHPLKR